MRNVFITIRLKRAKTGKGTASSSCCRGAEDREHRITQVGRDQAELSSFEYLKGQKFPQHLHPHGKINLPSTQLEFAVLQLLPCFGAPTTSLALSAPKGPLSQLEKLEEPPLPLLVLRLNTPDSPHLSRCATCSFPLCPVTGLAKGSCPLLEVLFEVREKETWRGDTPYQGKQDFHKQLNNYQ